VHIYVGNLSPIVSEGDLCRMFEAFGQVSSAIISEIIVKNKNSGRFQGFGFVEMPDRAEAEAAIENLNESGHLGPHMNINEAYPCADQGRSGGQGGHPGRPGRGGRSRYQSGCLPASEPGYGKEGKEVQKRSSGEMPSGPPKVDENGSTHSASEKSGTCFGLYV
jgi:RNA recognition motif-containing protein